MDKMRACLAPAPKTYDPMVSASIVPNQYQDFETFLKDIDLLVVMVHHTHLDENLDKVTGKVIFDTRNCRLPWDSSNRVSLL